MSWSSWSLVAGGVTTVGSPITPVARTPDHLDLFVAGSDERIYSTWWHEGGSWASWFDVSGGTASTGSPVTAVARMAEHLDLFVVGTDGGIYTAWWHEGQPWSSWFQVSGGQAPLRSRVEAVSRTADHLDLFVTGFDGLVYSTWWHQGEPWASWFNVAGVTAAPGAPVAAVARQPDHLDLFVVGTDGQVYTAWWHAGQPWSVWFPLPGIACTPGAHVTAVARSSDHLDVFVTAADGRVCTTSWHAGRAWAPWEHVSGGHINPGARVNAVARRAEDLDLFVTGGDDHIASTWWHEGQEWAPWFHVAGGLAAAASPVDVVARSPGQLDIFVTGGDGGIYTSSWSAATGQRTTFVPALHGFRFPNDFEVEVFNGLRFSGECGGMVYTALDYFRTGISIPTQAYRPAAGTPLAAHILRRQANSLADNADKWAELFFNPFGSRTDEFFNWGLQGTNGGRLEELRHEIDNGRPAPLGLFKAGDGGFAPHHQVLAIGYDMGRYRGDGGDFKEDLKIFIYDPNHPGEQVTLVPSLATRSYAYLEHPEDAWMTYFVDRRYQVDTPPIIPDEASSSDGLVRELLLEIRTGGDDLRGGNDNVHATVNFKSHPQLTVQNINGLHRWINNYTEIVPVRLTQPVPLDELASVVLTTTFGGGSGGDNWNLDRLRIITLGREIYNGSGAPLWRFTGQDQRFTADLSAIPGA